MQRVGDILKSERFARAEARGSAMILVGVLLLAACCLPASTRVRFEPVPAPRAIEIVNDNAAGVQGTVRALGAVDGRFKTRDGVYRSYHVQGVLFFHEPIFLRFDLKKLGNRQFLFGSNDRDFWVYSGAEDDYYCGKHAVPDDWPPDLPLRPDQLVNAIGLGPIPTADHVGGPFQRVVDDHQQILYLNPTESGGSFLGREYWVDRYAPRLLRRVIFRDETGRVEMETQLSDYKPLSGSVALLPHELLARWPKNSAEMRFRVRKWSLIPQVGPGDVQFTTPAQCED